MKKILILCMVLFVGFSLIGFNRVNAEEDITVDSEYMETGNEETVEDDCEVEEVIMTHSVFYEFVESMANGIGFLPDEVYDLLPEPKQISEGEYPEIPDLSVTSIGEYHFLGWNTPSIEVTTGDIVVQGIWENTGESFDAFLLSKASTVSGLGGAWTYVRQNGTGGFSHYQYTINGSPAWCIEPEVTGWPLAGTRYEEYGEISGKVANIIGMGVRNGMSAGAIQATLDNYAGYSSISSDGSNTDPESSQYSANGSYACKIDVYTPVGNEGIIQRLGTNPRCTPLNPKVSVRKESNSSFDYTNRCPGVYSLKGANYGIYSDVECTNELYVLTTDENGSTPSKELSPGTYYIKEISAPQGFKLDGKTYTVVLQNGSNETIVSKEDPYDDPTVIRLTKKGTNVNGYTKYLDTAEFTLRYYDTYEYDESQTPKMEWVFKPIIENGEAIVEFDRDHFISGEDGLFDVNDQLKIPLGSFTIEETKAPQTYLRDEEIYVGKVYLEGEDVKVVVDGGVNLHVKNEQLVQDEKSIIIKTTAVFEESGTDTYPADGYVHVIDNVEYNNLDIGKTYLLKTKLIDRTKSEDYYDQADCENGLCSSEDIGKIKNTNYIEGPVVGEYETVFVPENGDGVVKTVYELELDQYAEHDFVVYEYLYDNSHLDKLLSYHEDLDDEGQTVHVTRLYNAEFVLYKVSNIANDIRLSGAIFDVRSQRVKRDGQIVSKDLGRYVTGGIYYEDKNPFALTVSKDETLSDCAGIYYSKYDERFDVENVQVLDLDDGVYYVKKDDETDIRKWFVEKGSIYLDRQLEDTKLYFKERVAPVGYYLDENEYVMDVGHDTKLDRVENYRINALIVPYKAPITGVE